MKAYDPNSKVRDDNILIYGAPGAGKTHMCATVAKDYYTLLYDIDIGGRTVENLPPELQKNIVIVQHTDFKDLNTIYQQMLKGNTPEKWNLFFKKRGLDIQVEKPFEAIIIDSLSELQRQMETELMASPLEKMLLEPKEVTQLQIKEWGQIATLTEAVVADAFGSLPIITIFTAHERMSESPQTGEVSGTPKLRGQLAFDIGKHFDFMGRLTFARSGERVVYTATTRQWQSKTRGTHKNPLINPTMQDILKDL